MSDFWIPQDDSDLGVDRHDDTQAYNDYAMFVEGFERVMAAPIVTLADGSCLQISDRGQLDLGMIRDTVKARAVRWTLLRPWQWWRIPRILRHYWFRRSARATEQADECW